VQSTGTQSLETQPTGRGNCSLEFSPALSLRAKVTGVRLDGRALPFHIDENSSDQHVTMNIPIGGNRNVVEIQVKSDFELSESSSLPSLGSTSHGLRVLSESWTPSRDALSLQLSGAAGETYELSAWNPEQISSLEGAELQKTNGQQAQVLVKLPATAPGIDPVTTVVFHFVARP